MKVPAGHMILFSNMCLHSGGPNDSDRTLICVFGYITSNPYHFLKNEVCKYTWSTTNPADEEAVIVHCYEEVKAPLNAEKRRIEEKKRKLPIRKKSQDDVEMESKKIPTKKKSQDGVEIDDKKKK